MLLCTRHYAKCLLYSTGKENAQISGENSIALLHWLLSDNEACLLISSLLWEKILGSESGITERSKTDKERKAVQGCVTTAGPLRKVQKHLRTAYSSPGSGDFQPLALISH